MPAKPITADRKSKRLSLKEAVKEAHANTTIPTASYYALIKDSLRLKALIRGGVQDWDGYEDSFDDEYDTACIEELPAEMLD